MLSVRSFGYAAMNKELTAYSIEDANLDTCKRYCLNGDVVVERIPYKYGFNVSFTWHNYYKFIRIDKYQSQLNILWLHIRFRYEYSHKNGKIVYRS